MADLSLRLDEHPLLHRIDTQFCFICQPQIREILEKSSSQNPPNLVAERHLNFYSSVGDLYDSYYFNIREKAKDSPHMIPAHSIKEHIHYPRVVGVVATWKSLAFWQFTQSDQIESAITKLRAKVPPYCQVMLLIMKNIDTVNDLSSQEVFNLKIAGNPIEKKQILQFCENQPQTYKSLWTDLDRVVHTSFTDHIELLKKNMRMVKVGSDFAVKVAYEIFCYDAQLGKLNEGLDMLKSTQIVGLKVDFKTLSQTFEHFTVSALTAKILLFHKFNSPQEIFEGLFRCYRNSTRDKEALYLLAALRIFLDLFFSTRNSFEASINILIRVTAAIHMIMQQYDNYQGVYEPFEATFIGNAGPKPRDYIIAYIKKTPLNELQKLNSELLAQILAIIPENLFNQRLAISLSTLLAQNSSQLLETVEHAIPRINPSFKNLQIGLNRMLLKERENDVNAMIRLITLKVEESESLTKKLQEILVNQKESDFSALKDVIDVKLSSLQHKNYYIFTVTLNFNFVTDFLIEFDKIEITLKRGTESYKAITKRGTVRSQQSIVTGSTPTLQIGEYKIESVKMHFEDYKVSLKLPTSVTINVEPLILDARISVEIPEFLYVDIKNVIKVTIITETTRLSNGKLYIAADNVDNSIFEYESDFLEIAPYSSYEIPVRTCFKSLTDLSSILKIRYEVKHRNPVLPLTLEVPLLFKTPFKVTQLDVTNNLQKLLFDTKPLVQILEVTHPTAKIFCHHTELASSTISFASMSDKELKEPYVVRWKCLNETCETHIAPFTSTIKDESTIITKIELPNHPLQLGQSSKLKIAIHALIPGIYEYSINTEDSINNVLFQGFTKKRVFLSAGKACAIRLEIIPISVGVVTLPKLKIALVDEEDEEMVYSSSMGKIFVKTF